MKTFEKFIKGFLIFIFIGSILLNLIRVIEGEGSLFLAFLDVIFNTFSWGFICSVIWIIVKGLIWIINKIKSRQNKESEK